MRQLKSSQVWAFIVLQIFGTTLIGLSWGKFDQISAWGFLLGASAWTFFVLSTLFDFVPNKNEEVK